MKKLFLLLVCASLASAETSLERGKRVVMEALQALGGKNYLALEDRVEQGRAYSFYRERLSGLSIATIYTRYITTPDSKKILGVREREAFGKNEDSSVLFLENGEGWDITWRGARPLQADLLARYRETTLHNIFYILRQRLNEPGMIFDSQGADVILNQPVEIVDITDANNDSVTVYFNKDTKLPVRQVFYRRDPQTRDRIEEVSEFARYRDVGGGVQWPLTIHRERNGEKIYEIFSESVKINQDLTDNIFTLPSNVKKLK